MYTYDEIDRQIVRARVEEFRDQVERRISGRLTEDEFKPLRLMNGLYLQLHAYMLRVAIPYGVLSAHQLRALAAIADTFDRGYGHITTRQNIQFNWIKLADAPDILARLADADMHAIQTSGNCIRNVTTDAFAGATPDEVDDPRVWCEIIRQWSTFHPEFTYLPRKFKIAVNAASQDRAATAVHDIGLTLYRDAAGGMAFRVMVGGGLGRTPYVGAVIRDHLPAEHLLSYLEAVLRVYNTGGRRDNMYKARIKIQVHEGGVAPFREAVEAEWAQMQASGWRADLPDTARAQIAAHFALPHLPALTDALTQQAADEALDADFAKWVARNVRSHKHADYANVQISLKPSGQPPGDITSAQMIRLADLAEQFGTGEVRTTHDQNMVLPHVARNDLYTLWQELDAMGLGSANAGLATDIVACPGLDYCNLANTRSIPIATRIQTRLTDKGLVETVGNLTIKISGCINACGHHHVGHIGILGVDKKGEEFYQVTLGGSADECTNLGEVVGRGLSADRVIDAVEQLIGVYLARRTSSHERFIDTYRRLGADPFKEALYEVA